MASLYQVLAAMQQQVVAVTTNLTGPLGDILSVQTGILWPPINTLERLVQMRPPGALISVYDRKVGHDSTRWSPGIVAQTVTPALLVSSPADQIIVPGSTGTLTLSGGVASGDAVSLIVKSRGAGVVLDPGDGTYTQSPTVAVVYCTIHGDSPASAAAGLVSLANADPAVSPRVVCTSSGTGTVTIQNLLPSAIEVNSYTGNGGTNVVEIGRRKRELQLTVWSPSPEIRDIVFDPIESMVQEMEIFRGSSGQYTAGLVLADGSFARIEHYNDYLVDDPVLADLYRRDEILCADYPVTSQDKLYSVLAPVTQYQITV